MTFESWLDEHRDKDICMGFLGEDVLGILKCGERQEAWYFEDIQKERVDDEKVIRISQTIVFTALVAHGALSVADRILGGSPNTEVLVAEFERIRMDIITEARGKNRI